MALVPLQFTSWQSSEHAGQGSERIVVSVILMVARKTFYGKGGSKGGSKGGEMWKEVWARLQDEAYASGAKYISHSTVSYQIRMDFVFQNESQGQSFNVKVKAIVSELPELVSKNTFVLREEQYGLGLEPVLWEKDILQIICQSKLRHFLRHFIGCEVIMEKGQCGFRFRCLSDLNLFLFSKVFHPQQRNLGQLRECVKEEIIVVDNSVGSYKLFTRDKEVSKIKDKCISSKFTLEPREEGTGYSLLFSRKVDMFKFYATKDSGVEHLNFDDSCLKKLQTSSPSAPSDGESSGCVGETEKKRAELRQLYTEISEKEKNIKIKDSMIKTLLIEIESSKDQLKGLIGEKVSVSLNQILSMDFKGETDGKSYHNCLLSFLRSSGIKAVEELDGTLVFIFCTKEALDQELHKLTRRSLASFTTGILEERSSFIPGPEGGYEIKVEIREPELEGLTMKSIQKLEKELEQAGAKVTVTMIGFSAKFPNLLDLLRTLSNGELVLYHHPVVISSSYILYKDFLSEHQLLSLTSLSVREEDNGKEALSSRAVRREGSDRESLSFVLRDPMIHRVAEDWQGKTVAVFAGEQDLRNLLRTWSSSRSHLCAMKIE